MVKFAGGHFMTIRVAQLLTALNILCLGLLASAQTDAVNAQATPVATPSLAATIDASKQREPISPYMYGMFMENKSDLMNRTLWSEMLEDRKFYFPITTAEPKEMAQSSQPKSRRWIPVGSEAFITMDQDHPYVGEQTPLIAVEERTPHGIQQSGLALVKGKNYTGRIVLAGTPNAKVTISLVWGSAPNERETVTIENIQAAYTKFPLQFASPLDTLTARLEIVGVGSGSFHIGAVSLMPVDNVHGFRPDTTSLLRALKSGMYRVNGGNFLSGDDWRDAIGDPDKRPPVWDYAWNTMQPNDVGFDEWMTLCHILGVEPYVTVNAGLGDAHSAAELVTYSNGGVDTPMGALRARNGHPEPYHVKYWNVGNEPYGFWQIGHTALKFFTVKHNAFAKAMRKVDPSITIIASGAMPDEMTVTSNALKVTGKAQSEFGTAGDWTGGLLAGSWGYFDGLSEHWYCWAGKRFDLNNNKDFYNPSFDVFDAWVPVNESLIEWLRRPSNRVREKAEAWQEYKKRFPAIGGRKMFVAIDEWAYIGTQSDLKLALSYGMVMQEMFRHTDFIKMSAFTQGVATLDYSETHAIYNTVGLMFKLYGEHLGTIPVEVTGNSPQPAPNWPVGGDQPRVNAGGSTYPLDVVAALSEDRRFLTIAVINPTQSAQQMELKIRGIQLGGKPQRWKMAGLTADAANILGQKTQVEIVNAPISGVPEKLFVDPISINIYRFSVL